MKNLVAIFIIALIIFWGCKKKSTPNSPNLPALTTTVVTNITDSTAASGGTITNNGESGITTRGIVCSTDSLPTVAQNFLKTTDGAGTGSFASNLKGLSPGTKYYVRAYATNSAGNGYGNSVVFKTTGNPLTQYGDTLPTVTTTAVANITDSSATSGGTINNNGGSGVIARGIVCSKDSLPTVDQNLLKTSDGSGTGPFTSSLRGLSPSTKYFVRAYAINSKGIGYGNSIAFTTADTSRMQNTDTLPTVTTMTITNITSASATVEGNVVSDGGSPVTSRGIVYGTNSLPTLYNSNYTINGTGTGVFSGNLTGLYQQITYYVRAYATNSKGTSYGNQLVFQTTQNSYGFTLYKDQFVDTTLFTYIIVGGKDPTTTYTISYINDLQLPPGINLYIKFDSVYGNINAGADNNPARLVHSKDTMNFVSSVGVLPLADQFSEDSKCFYSIHIEGQALTNQNEYYCKYLLQDVRTISFDFIHLVADTSQTCNFMH